MPELLLNSNNTRSVFTKKQLRDKVRSEVGLFDSNWIRDADVDSWMLEFQNILARDEEWYAFNTQFTTSGGVKYYDLPPDCITIKVVQYGVWKLPHESLQDLLIDYPLALTTTYKGPLPWCYTIDGANRLMLFPTPTVASGVLVIYASLPPEPVSDDDLYYWPPYMDTAAIFYGCQRGSMKDLSREGGKRLAVFSAAYEREYQKGVARIKHRAAEDILVYGEANVRRSSLGRGSYPRRVPMP